MERIRRTVIALLASLVSLVALGSAAPEAQAQPETGCVDSDGTPVLSVPNANLSDVAMASTAPNGQPIITYNPNVLARLSAPSRRFWYMHECGHHALAHAARNIPLSQEQEADCFGIVALVRRGEVDANGVRQIQSELTQAGPGDWQHLPGPQRALNLSACLNAAGLGSSSPPAAPAPRCRPVVVEEMRTELVTQMISEYQPCAHCGCTPYGCGCAHPGHVVAVSRSVPVSRMVPVTRLVCE